MALPIQQAKHTRSTLSKESQLEGRLTARDLPPYKARVDGAVQSLNWANPQDRNAACQMLYYYSINSPEAPTRPILIKGAVSDWPALHKWTLDNFMEQYGNCRVAVRYAPSMNFFYVEPLLLPWWQKWVRLSCQGHRLPPSDITLMPMREFVARLQKDCTLEPLLYKDQEFYYMQSSLANGMVQDINLYAPPLSCLGAPGAAGAPGESPALMPSGLKIAQIPRIFASPAGAVSPLHYDTASSFLTQIRGRKRLILYQPADLDNLYPYNRLHILRRRARVDPTNPDYKRFPRFERTVGVEALLEPGDVLWFPGYWSHYTESLDFSVSMTYRFWTEAQSKRPKRGLRGLFSK